jgi:hypothetical protein
VNLLVLIAPLFVKEAKRSGEALRAARCYPLH